MDESILHCDLNGFYASVECIFRPELRRVPMAVSGNPENRHGIILAKNEPAKKFGIQTAETIWQAKRKCPKLVLVPARHGVYGEYSKKVNEIYSRFTNKVEPFGLDESWLDVSGSRKLFGSGVEIADKIRKTVREELGLTVSVGVSFNKVFSKLGSDYKKPDATTLISRENFREIVWPLDVSSLLFVGKRTAESLRRMRVLTIGELAATDKKLLERKFGAHGGYLYEAANGLSESEVAFAGESDDAKSVGNSVTYHRDISGMEEIRAAVIDLSETVSARLRRKGFKGSVVQVAIKDPQFHCITRQTTVENPTNLAGDIADASMKIIMREWDIDSPVRLLGISVTGLIPASSASTQMSVFDEENVTRQKRKNVQDAMEKVREKFGRGSISRGAVAWSDIFGPAAKKKKKKQQ